MDYDTRDAIHLISLKLAKAVHAADQRNSEDFLEFLELYKEVRRMLPKNSLGKRWGASEAYDMIQYGGVIPVG